ncbi:MAG TPA: Uma2 family endonuclease [Pirellulales bacterium]|jgi:Uma2 family endonuclease|nr:Uma2 family endonuclease [Pirellulales bacterium]
MASNLDYTSLPGSASELTWEIARLFPAQGCWTEDEYLALQTNQLIEFTDGRLEFLPMPTALHQLIAGFLYRALIDFVKSRKLGMVLMAAFKVKVGERKFREPDVQFMFASNAARMRNEFWTGADLVMEIVSPDDPHRDLVQKRAEYATAGIAEYWIVHPREATITILQLDGASYPDQPPIHEGQIAASALLPGFAVEVAAVFEEGRAALK